MVGDAEPEVGADAFGEQVLQFGHFTHSTANKVVTMRKRVHHVAVSLDGHLVGDGMRALWSGRIR